MIAIPAIDLRDGHCVQLVGGSFDDERVRLPDPLAVARRWIEAGFRRLHLVDLDAALGTGSNHEMIDQLVELSNATTQVGGGVRTTAAAERLLRAGASHVVVGTRALGDREWLTTLATDWPNRIIVAADARNGMVLTHGWTAATEQGAIEVIRDLTMLPLAGFLITAVDREGRMSGPDLSLMTEATEASTRPVIASGGIGTMDDLAALERRGIDAAVIGMALYSGALDARAVAREFNA